MDRNVELWERELIAAGWKRWRKRWTVWVAPNGSLHLGPYGAWRTMTALRADASAGTGLDL